MKRFPVKDLFWLTLSISLLAWVIVLSNRKSNQQFGSSLELFARTQELSVFRNSAGLESVTLIYIPKEQALTVAIGNTIVGTDEFVQTDSIELKPGLWTIAMQLENNGSSIALECRCIETSSVMAEKVTGRFVGKGFDGLQSGWLRVSSCLGRRFGIECIELGSMQLMRDDLSEIEVLVLLKDFSGLDRIRDRPSQ